MRRMLRILGWMGLGLSTILFVGTGVLWVRSLGFRERWRVERYEPHPEWPWDTPGAGGIYVERHFEATNGRIWFGWRAYHPAERSWSEVDHRREECSDVEALRDFRSAFGPLADPGVYAVDRRYRFGGLGFCQYALTRDPDTGRSWWEGWYAVIPCWMLAVVFGLWPVCFAAWRVFRRRRYGAGLCQECGYDLRATPDRCPECGRASRQRAAGPS